MERNISVWLPLTCSPLETWPATQAMCPDWESNQRPFGSQACAQSTELHQAGLFLKYSLKQKLKQIKPLNLTTRLHEKHFK